MKITIIKEPNADSRTSKKDLTKDELLSATKRHIDDVEKGLIFFADMLVEAGKNHDNTKTSDLNDFYESLTSGKIKDSNWYHKHITKERHHLISNVPEDVNLVDIFEHLVDCVMAGLSRSGEIYDIELTNEVLQLAHRNTVELLKKNIGVVESNDILDHPISNE